MRLQNLMNGAIFNLVEENKRVGLVYLPGPPCFGFFQLFIVGEMSLSTSLCFIIDNYKYSGS